MRNIFKLMAILALVGGLAACNKNIGPEGTGGTEGSGDSSDGIKAVDLGLSVKWASCNVGGQKESDSGYCFAWGETEEKGNYDWTHDGDYKWGNKGCTVTSRANGKSIFLPALGYRYETGRQYAGKCGCYWSSTVDESNLSQACYLRFSSDEFIATEGGRQCGLAVRAVTED